MNENSVFVTLNEIDVSEHIEKKNNLSYLPWAWAWAEVKKRYPTETYTIYENADGLFYHTDGRTCWVKTGVTILGIEHIEYLPVMDYKNNSIPLERVTSFDVNKAIQRSLTKACARHGIGLYVYAGEDLPEGAKQKEQLAPELIAEANKAGVDIAKVAAYLKKDIDDLTNDELRQCIEAKKRNRARQKANEGEGQDG